MVVKINDAPEEAQHERVLLYAESNMGKSFSVLCLAEYLNETSPDSKIWVLDPDRGIQKAWKQEKPAVKIKYIATPDWPTLEEALDHIEDQISPNDWVVCEMMGRYWEMAQSYEVGEVYGSKAGEYLLLARQKAIQDAKSNKPATLSSVDWQVVKKLHNDDFADRVASWDCNILWTTAADRLIQELDAPQTLSTFESVGFKPDGEKRNVHRVDTAMFMYKNAKGRYITTVKDRGRPLMTDLAIGSNIWVSFDSALRGKGFNFFHE